MLQAPVLARAFRFRVRSTFAQVRVLTSVRAFCDTRLPRSSVHTRYVLFTQRFRSEQMFATHRAVQAVPCSSGGVAFSRVP